MRKKKNIFRMFLLIVISIGSLGGCISKEENYENKNVVKISSQKAKEIIDSEEDVVILDVRTEEEFNSGHIKDAVLVPVDDIQGKIQEVIENKNSKIMIYCRSGNRSATAAQKMKELGYTNIYDFGGINTWKGEIIK